MKAFGRCSLWCAKKVPKHLIARQCLLFGMDRFPSVFLSSLHCRISVHFLFGENRSVCTSLHESEFSIKVVERSDRFQKKERVDKMVSVQYYEVMSRRVMAYRVIARRAVVSETQRLEQVFMCESAPAVHPIFINF